MPSNLYNGVGGLFRKIRLFDQMRSNDAVDNPQHPAHDRRTAGEQEKTENSVQLFAKVEKVQCRHTAGLNFGDCFSYALAKSLGEPLLFKGDDLSATDIDVYPVD